MNALGPLHTTRGSFHSAPYALPKNKHPAREKFYRLMDLMLTIKSSGPEFCDAVQPNEFAVVDLLREEKGWFEKPDDYPAEKVHAMIESHFGQRALRVSARVWVV